MNSGTNSQFWIQLQHGVIAISSIMLQVKIPLCFLPIDIIKLEYFTQFVMIR